VETARLAFFRVDEDAIDSERGRPTLRVKGSCRRPKSDSPRSGQSRRSRPEDHARPSCDRSRRGAKDTRTWGLQAVPDA